ncbi:MAG: vWA domain-containing protein, partial [Candidatus Promineifilaceae bacterium]
MSFSNPAGLLLLLAAPYFVQLARQGQGLAAGRDWAALGLRLAILLLLALGLGGLELVRPADDLAVVFLLDGSDSIGPTQAEEAEALVRETIEALGPAERAAVVVFGANALVERPMSGLAELAPITSTPLSLQTDIAAAIRLGLALFPAGSARRLVLISDGAAT